MDAEHTPPASALRPLRRTDKLIVREVGDELVAYALDTEQVTALDPATATVFNRLDGSATIDEIADASDMAVADVETAVVRLHDAGLLASGFDRRRFLRLAAAGVGTGALLTIAAPEAAFAASVTSVTWTTTCSAPKANDNTTTASLTISGVSLNGAAAGETHVVRVLAGSSNPPTVTAFGPVNVTGGSWGGTTITYPKTNTSYYVRLQITNPSGTTYLTPVRTASISPGSGNNVNCNVA